MLTYRTEDTIRQILLQRSILAELQIASAQSAIGARAFEGVIAYYAAQVSQNLDQLAAELLLISIQIGAHARDERGGSHVND